MIRGHGNDRYLFDIEIKGDFSSNIAYNNHSDKIISYLRENLDTIRHYPDPEAKQLTRLIAKHHGIATDQILVTAGSAEAFYLMAHRLGGARSVIGIPAFAEYEDACRLFGHDLRFVPLAELFTTPLDQAETIWWGSPNNPDGQLSTPDQVGALISKYPQAHYIIDCAYAHLSDMVQDLTPLHSEYPQLITIHSLTKVFDIPGLRLGYIIAPSPLIDELRGYQTPWSVNALAQEVGRYIMQNFDALMPDITQLIQESRSFQRELSGISQLRVTSSDTNYFLVRMQEGTAADLKAYLIHTHGLLIRDASNFRGLSPQHFRVAVQDPVTNANLIKAIADYFDHYHVH